MYAIRSYYAPVSAVLVVVAAAIALPVLLLAVPVDMAFRLEGNGSVITSYSIHYTKLYDPMTTSSSGW